ncbi:hypothetical protein BB561_005024 [Smittium simulii]|uniref:Uncharacterized protein n=1 Tax=Smittium simulii TaxID=133385 RepID=A0A2T9YCL2_9FUNG|nr:hypothetical protein BB561_005024 [Smittium simulii]
MSRLYSKQRSPYTSDSSDNAQNQVQIQPFNQLTMVQSEIKYYTLEHDFMDSIPDSQVIIIGSVLRSKC